MGDYSRLLLFKKLGTSSAETLPDEPLPDNSPSDDTLTMLFDVLPREPIGRPGRLGTPVVA